MNPFFWFLVLASAALLWVALRKLFIWVGGKVSDIAEDTKNILYGEDAENENKGESDNE